MSKFKSRLKKLEPKPFEPVHCSWRLERAGGIVEEGEGTYDDLGRAIFGPDSDTEEEEAPSEQHSSPTSKA